LDHAKINAKAHVVLRLKPKWKHTCNCSSKRNLLRENLYTGFLP